MPFPSRGQIRNGIGINEQVSIEFEGIRGMWSLRSGTDDPHDTFLVVSLCSETRILAMNLEETEIEGFCSNAQTLFCHDAIYNQLVQVTSNSVRLVSSTSRELCNEWSPPVGYSISVATANSTQILLATGGGHIFYLEIGDGVLTEAKHAQLECEIIACLDINPIGDNPNYSQLAAVGTCIDVSVRIFSLPDLNLITQEHLGGEVIPRSVLLCSFEGISYLLCALGDGHLLNFVLNTDRKKIPLGTQPITLRTFSSKNATHVFAASDRPTVIYSSNKKLLYSNVNLKEVSHMCPFNAAAFPDSLAIAKEGKLTIGTIVDIQKLHIVPNGIGIYEQASVELEGIRGMWSLRSATDDPHDTFLVLSFISETRIFAMNLEDELEESEIEGFCSDAQTLFCHDAVYDQLVQVTSNSVRLVSSTSGELRNEWFSPAGYSISVATANSTQILLATGGGHIFYLEIGDGVLTEAKHAQLECEIIACLDINPIGDNPNYSQLAAVGTWIDVSVRIFSLPDLNLITQEHLGGEIIPRSVLLCSFEGISYLLCALGDGHLLNYLLNTDRKKVPLGTRPITLRTFSSKNATHVFAASDRPTVIYSRNKKLLYSNVNLKEVSHMCPFNAAAFPDSLAIAEEGELIIGTIDDIQLPHIHSIPLGENARCHPELQVAICDL